MSEYLLKLAATQGIWTVLSMFLIIYILKNQSVRDQNQSERDQNYRKIISSLIDRNDELNTIENKLEEITLKFTKTEK